MRVHTEGTGVEETRGRRETRRNLTKTCSRRRHHTRTLGSLVPEDGSETQGVDTGSLPRNKESGFDIDHSCLRIRASSSRPFPSREKTPRDPNKT